MADWEQPSTSVLRKSGAGGPSGDEELRTLREALAAALERIGALEERVTNLEAQVQGQRGQALGA